jgi:tRNA A37 N6-isopentenylltransferase MiaA
LAADDPLLVICGPTAAGKSRLAMRLADERPITILSADSRQIYRRFDIGTAKPDAADRAAVPHAGLDLIDGTERYSAFRWAAVAAEAIDEARAAGRMPVIVGGAGFYIRALITPAPDVVRYDARYLLVDPGPVLADRIAGRVDAMWDAGWPEEIEALSAVVPAEAPAWQATGYAALREALGGRATLTAALAAVVIATRQYAKRQRTWFRHQLPSDRVLRVDPADPAAVTTAGRYLEAWQR